MRPHLLVHVVPAARWKRSSHAEEQAPLPGTTAATAHVRGCSAPDCLSLSLVPRPTVEKEVHSRAPLHCPRLVLAAWQQAPTIFIKATAATPSVSQTLPTPATDSSSHPVVPLRSIIITEKATKKSRKLQKNLVLTKLSPDHPPRQSVACPHRLSLPPNLAPLFASTRTQRACLFVSPRVTSTSYTTVSSLHSLLASS